MTFFKHYSQTVSLNGIRAVDEIRPRPQGGPPYHEEGRITYEDGTVVQVSLGMARALSLHLTKPQSDNTPPTKTLAENGIKCDQEK